MKHDDLVSERSMECPHCHRRWPYIDPAEADQHQDVCLGLIAYRTVYVNGSTFSMTFPLRRWVQGGDGGTQRDNGSPPRTGADQRRPSDSG